MEKGDIKDLIGKTIKDCSLSSYGDNPGPTELILRFSDDTRVIIEALSFKDKCGEVMEEMDITYYTVKDKVVDLNP